MKVLLVYSNVMKEAWVPIGLLYIAANLRKNKIDVKIADSKFDTVFEIIEEYEPDFIGLGGMTVMANHAIKLGKEIKEKYPEIKFVYGGVHFTFMPEEAKDIADYIILGEGEKAFVDICNGAYSKNVMYRVSNDVGDIWINHDNRNYELIDDLDSLPFPAYDLIDMNKYSDELVTGEKAISILTGRGCPYNCSFCASPRLWKRKTRYHSIEYTIKHIQFLIDNYNLKNLRIMDDTFTCDNDRVLTFCDAIEKNNIKLKMTCLTNVHNADENVFRRMKEVGFDIVAFGLESVDKHVLLLAQKANTEKNMRHAVELAHKVGLRTELLFMVGNMGETKETLRKSLDFAKSLNGYKTYFQLATPFPGSKFYDDAEKYGKVIDRDWDKYNHKDIKYIPNGLDEKTMIDSVKEGTKN